MSLVGPKNKLANLFALLQSEFGAYRTPILGLSVLSFVGGLLEGIGINSVIPLFSFVNKSATKGTDTISQTIEKFFSFFHLAYTLKTILIFIIGLFLVKAIIGFITTYISAKINTTYERNTRSGLFKLTLQAEWPYLSQQKIGHLEQTLTTDVTNSSVLLSYLSGTMLTVANLLVYILIAVNISPLIAALTSFVGIVVFFTFKPLFYRNRVVSQKVETTYKQLAHYVNEHMLGMKTIKATSSEAPIKEQADIYFDQVKNLNADVIAVRNLTNTLLQPIGLIFIIAIFSFFYKMTAFNFASFAVIVYAINKMFAYIQLAQSQIHAMSSMVPYTKSIQNYREEVGKKKEKDMGAAEFTFNNTLEFKDVNFTYHRGEETLSHISLNVKKGSMVGIIGPSGAGKTTLVDLLLRLLPVSGGRILLDGKDIQEIRLKEWRKSIGYVSQDMFLINDTIENNIKFYNPAITHDEVIAAAKLANLHEFIEQQPEGFATVIGERGISVSGGEKQRIILARILARQPQILILDEATSALDNESEALIQRAIERLKGNMTIIIIAHRLSTIKTVDTLVALENGKVREQGTPEELLKDKNSYFFRVYNVR
ncbi:MAG: hypothetical protein A2754_00110 [Candidatus Magasanikbacteria bacterium RIFCSPHIGHO2_01_FULL_47_8]|uniref:ABC transporter ATP-binding protein n=1 Tax=Candidatus Magasanikbacteria bacterium RIFCSPHIGHO2_01_FULL_47_8 TaxID=1798673 RepID=A0A1F6MEE5_9BACT|nr:MAG: hypothetical protein A2754_00110 [Candidatus Magasanikbacteria bacterium RIFCSPHIGHO2_01_FULL_47_8]